LNSQKKVAESLGTEVDDSSISYEQGSKFVRGSNHFISYEGWVF